MRKMKLNPQIMMMHKFLAIIALSLTILLMGCPQERVIPPDTSCKDIDIVNLLGSSNSGRSFSIQSAKITDQSLEIEVSYNCGCGDSEFKLQTKADFKESFPVQTDISLILKGNDNCEALCQATLCFDLNDLADEYESAYPGQGGTLHINLEDFDDVISLAI